MLTSLGALQITRLELITCGICQGSACSLCKGPARGSAGMVECEGCEEWHHPECLQLSKEEVEAMAHFVCPECTKRHLSNSSKKMRMAEEGR